MIRMQLDSGDSGHWSPVIVCDHCKEIIADAGHATAYWKRTDLTVVHVHEGECEIEFLAECFGGTLPISDPLLLWLGWFAHPFLLAGLGDEEGKRITNKAQDAIVAKMPAAERPVFKARLKRAKP
jgi:hypothetical protein